MDDLLKLVRTYRVTTGLAERLRLAEEIFQRVEPDLRLFVFSHIRPPATDDVLQEVLAAVATSLGRFTGNTPGEFWAWAYRIAHNKLNALLDEVLSVDEVGIFKPDPRVYQLACDRMGFAGNAIGFVSSNGWDAAGAKAFGFTTFWINRAKTPLEMLGVKPDYVLNSLNELGPLVG